MGSTTIQSNVWYHVAFVYDYPTSSAYQGTSGDIVIGKTEQVPGTPNYFSG